MTKSRPSKSKNERSKKRQPKKPPETDYVVQDHSKTHRPQAHFEGPSEVPADETLSGTEKKEALDTWEQDARQLLTASNEGMPGKEEGLSRDDAHKLGEVVRAKAVIGAKPRPKSTH